MSTVSVFGRHRILAAFFAIVAVGSFFLSLLTVPNFSVLGSLHLWEGNFTPFLSVFSLFVSALTGCLALVIEHQQAVQSDYDANSQLELLDRIDGLSSSAAREAQYAHVNTDLILQRMRQAEASKMGKPLSLEQEKRVIRAYFKNSHFGTRALWVDDVPGSVRNERGAFEAAGIMTTLVRDTGEALSILRDNGFDVVISDMGRFDNDRAGYELLSALRQGGCSTPFVIYSSSRDPEHVAEVIDRGGQGATNDPVELFEIILNVI
ncbi:response regulator [Actinomyces oris]|uniref:response regulator n=1 Tax=Actinomyces oris TaxID=544580 RepID=UPI0009D73A30|nr:response regulator [Actinomyces oris]